MNPVGHPLRQRAVAFLTCVLALTTFSIGGAADEVHPRGQVSEVRDLIIARRNLMASVGRNMDGITGMVEPGGQLDPADASEHADEIAVMLLAFPYLFPPGSDNWTAQRERDDPAGVTEASARVWQDPKAFRAMARAASQLATDTSRPADAAQFRLRAAALAETCVACHARFRREEKPYVVPVPPLAAAPGH